MLHVKFSDDDEGQLVNMRSGKSVMGRGKAKGIIIAISLMLHESECGDG